MSQEKTVWSAALVMNAVAKLMADGRPYVTMNDICAAVDHPRDKTIKAIRNCKDRGYLEAPKYSDGPSRRGCVQLTAAGREALEIGRNLRSGSDQTGKARNGPTNTLRSRAWRLIRARQKVSLDDLESTLSDADGPAINRSGLGRYFNALAWAGIVKRLGTPMQPRWLLIENVGPRAPTVSGGDGRVFDPNTRRRWHRNRQTGEVTVEVVHG